jgi:threonine dehydrogenase-like Zn-dependent dehydrogenase
MYGAHDVRVETVPDARIVEPTDALVRVTRACICGSDLWPYNAMPLSETGNRMGHEFVGVVESIGSDVRTVKRGDLVVAPFAWSDGTCEFCQQGLQTSCLHGGWWGGTKLDGGQGEAVRVPLADGTLVALPVGPDHALMPSLLTLSDVMGTGHHAALRAHVHPARPPPSWVMARWVSAASLPPVVSVRSRSSCSAVTPTVLPWPAGSGRPMSSVSGGTPRSSGYAS